MSVLGELSVAHLYLLLWDCASEGEQTERAPSQKQLQALYHGFCSQLQQFGLQGDVVSHYFLPLCQLLVRSSYTYLLYEPEQTEHNVSSAEQHLKILADVLQRCLAWTDGGYSPTPQYLEPSLAQFLDSVHAACLQIEATRALRVGAVKDAFDALNELDQMLRAQAATTAHVGGGEVSAWLHTALCVTWSLMAEACIKMRRLAHAVLYAQAAIRAGHQGIRGAASTSQTSHAFAVSVGPKQAAVLSYYTLSSVLACSGLENSHLTQQWFTRTLSLCKYHVGVSAHVWEYLRYCYDVVAGEELQPAFASDGSEEDDQTSTEDPLLQMANGHGSHYTDVYGSPFPDLEKSSQPFQRPPHEEQPRPQHQPSPARSYISTPSSVVMDAEAARLAERLHSKEEMEHEAAMRIQCMVRRRQARQQASKYSRHLAFVRRQERKQSAARTIQATFRRHHAATASRRNSRQQQKQRQENEEEPQQDEVKPRVEESPTLSNEPARPLQQTTCDRGAAEEVIEQEQVAAMGIAVEIIQRNVRAYLRRRAAAQYSSTIQSLVRQLSSEAYVALRQSIAAVATSVQLAHFVFAISHKSAASNYRPSDWFLESSSAQDILEAVKMRKEKLRELREAIRTDVNAAGSLACEDFVRSRCFDWRECLTEPGRSHGIVTLSDDRFVRDVTSAVIEQLGVRDYNACQLVKRIVDLELYDLLLASLQERQELSTLMDECSAVKPELAGEATDSIVSIVERWFGWSSSHDEPTLAELLELVSPVSQS